MTKYQPYSRRVFRRRFGLWLRRNAKLMVFLTIGAIGLLVLIPGIALLSSPNGFGWWATGAGQATLVAGYVFVIREAFLAHDGEAIWHLRGAWGEDNTRSELQRAKRKRLIWGWVDSIGFQVGDLDHLVVTRAGGLVAVDSKWRIQPTDKVQMAQAAKKVRLRAQADEHVARK